MKLEKRPVACIVSVIALLTALLVAAAPATAGRTGVGKPDGDDLASRFPIEQMSGAARSVLQIRSEGPRSPDASSQAALAPTDPGSLVNDPSADATAQDTQSETSITLAGSNVLVGFNDSGSCTPVCGVSNQFTGYSVSTDGGATFTDRGTLPASAEGDAGDPVVAHHDATGTTYFSTLGFTTGECLQVFRSTDGGVNFGAPVCGTPGYTATGFFQDKEWIAVDNFAGAGNGNAYMAWRAFPPNPNPSGITGGIRFVRSTDGGATWGPNQGFLIASQGANNVQGAFVVVGPDHAVYVFWWDQSAGLATPGIIRMRKSTDQGVTFGPPVTVATLAGTATNGNLGLGGLRSNSFPHAAVNPVSGNVYVVFNDLSGGDKANVYVTQSTDGGSTWTPRVQMNDDATTNDQFFPTIAVQPDGSRLMVGFYDRRHDPLNTQIQHWGAIGEISGSSVTFGPNFATGPAFPVVRGQDPVVNTTYMGDYDQIAANDDEFFTIWGDNRDSNSFHNFQPDVRFARVPEDASAGSANLSVTKSDAVDPVNTGDTINYTLTVSNAGPDSAHLVSLTDVLPTGYTALSATPSQGTCTKANIVTCDLGAIANGGNATVTIGVLATASGLPSNSASVASATPDPTPGNNSTAEDTTVNGSTVTTTYSTGPIAVPVPDNTTIEVPLSVPDDFSVLDANARLRMNHTFDSDLNISLVHPDGSAQRIAWALGGSGDNFGSGATDCTGTFTAFDDEATTHVYFGAPPYAGSFRPEEPMHLHDAKSSMGTWRLRIQDAFTGDTGTVFCFELDLTQAVAPAEADLSIVKSDSPDPVTVGEPLTYTLDVDNAGPDTASDVTVIDNLPASVTFVSATPSQGTCSEASGTVTCNLGSLPSGGSATVTIEVTPNQEGTITDTAEVSSATTDPDMADNSDSEDTTVVGAPEGQADLSLTKTDRPDPVAVGSRLTYRLRIVNLGPDTATGVTATDELPAGVTFVFARSRQGTCTQAGGIVTCDLGSLAVGGRALVRIRVQPNAPGTLTNTAEVSANEADPNTGNNSDTEQTTVQ